MPASYDVAVVGSGPAGAACALGLARLGASVVLIDEGAFPRTKVCGEYLNSGAVRALRELGLGPQLEAHALTLRGMRLFAHGERAEFAFAYDAWSIPRSTLDDTIRTAALRAGAEEMRGRVRAVTCDESGVSVRLTDENDAACEVRAGYVLGADGMRSTVAKACGLSKASKAKRFATGGHYGGLGLEGWIEMYATSRGYLALNPLDSDTANVMFVVNQEQLRQSRGALDAELARFSDEVTRGARRIDEVRLREKRHTIGPLEHRTTGLTKPRVLLVGDAGAFVDPFSGQGVFLALTGARAAIAAVGRALRSADDEAAAWRDYGETMRNAVAERSRVTLMMKAMLAVGFASRRAARALRARPEQFAPLIDMVCGNTSAPKAPQLALALARALR